MSGAQQIWMTIGLAAAEARCPKRSAFRWVRAGRVAVKTVQGRRLVEVGALRALLRTFDSEVAQARAIGGEPCGSTVAAVTLDQTSGQGPAIPAPTAESRDRTAAAEGSQWIAGRGGPGAPAGSGP